jgi:Lar family restriction alleviation protein
VATDLKRCPFCGGKAEYITKIMQVRWKEQLCYRIRCSSCFAQSPYKRNAYLHGFHETLNAAVDAWNGRYEDA